MSTEVFVRQKRVVDSDDVLAQYVTAGAPASVPAASTVKLTFNKTNSTNFVLRGGVKARCVFIGNDVDSGGSPYLTFQLLVNGNMFPAPYNSFTQAVGTTYTPGNSFTIPFDLPQNALIECVVINSNVTTAYGAFLRMRIEYEEIE